MSALQHASGLGGQDTERHLEIVDRGLEIGMFVQGQLQRAQQAVRLSHMLRGIGLIRLLTRLGLFGHQRHLNWKPGS